MIGHMHPVITIQDHKTAGEDKSDPIFPVAALSDHIRKQGEAEHHGSYCHVAAWPRLETIIASRKVGNHLPPVTKFACRII